MRKYIVFFWEQMWDEFFPGEPEQFSCLARDEREATDKCHKQHGWEIEIEDVIEDPANH